jgi:hypothetical protein
MPNLYSLISPSIEAITAEIFSWASTRRSICAQTFLTLIQVCRRPRWSNQVKSRRDIWRRRTVKKSHQTWLPWKIVSTTLSGKSPDSYIQPKPAVSSDQRYTASVPSIPPMGSSVVNHSGRTTSCFAQERMTIRKQFIVFSLSSEGFILLTLSIRKDDRRQLRGYGGTDFGLVILSQRRVLPLDLGQPKGPITFRRHW